MPLDTLTVGDLAMHRFVRRAQSINRDAAEIEHDPGPETEWSAFFADAPLHTYQAHPSDFRLDFGPVYYRGRLDGTARVLVVGQDPAANELLGHRVFIGASGQRVQGFLRRIGIRRNYLMVNTFLYPVFGQFIGSLRQLSQDPDILGYRNRLLDKIAAEIRFRQSSPLVVQRETQLSDGRASLTFTSNISRTRRPETMRPSCGTGTRD